MNFKVKINEVFETDELKGFATLIIEDKIHITGFKIVEIDKRLCVFCKSRKDKQGKYKDVYFIEDEELRNKVYKEILFEYKKCTNRC